MVLRCVATDAEFIRNLGARVAMNNKFENFTLAAGKLRQATPGVYAWTQFVRDISVGNDRPCRLMSQRGNLKSIPQFSTAARIRIFLFKAIASAVKGGLNGGTHLTRPVTARSNGRLTNVQVVTASSYQPYVDTVAIGRCVPCAIDSQDGAAWIEQNRPRGHRVKNAGGKSIEHEVRGRRATVEHGLHIGSNQIA